MLILSDEKRQVIWNQVAATELLLNGILQKSNLGDKGYAILLNTKKETLEEILHMCRQTKEALTSEVKT